VRVRLAFTGIVLGVIVFLGVALAALLVHTSRDRAEEALQQRLLAIAVTAANGLDGDLHRRVDSAESSAFTRLRDQLRDVQRVNGLDTAIYTLVPSGPETTRFVVMTNPTPYVGHEYLYQPGMRPTFERGEPGVTGVYGDEHGHWISAYAPIKDSSGEVVALLEVDETAETLGALHQEEVATLLALLVGCLALGLVPAVWLSDRVARALQRHQDALQAQAQELERKNRALTEADRYKSEFIANMSHEFRTPLNSILGYCDLVGMGELSERGRDYLGRLRKAGDALLGLIEDLLSYARIEAGSDSLSPANVDLGEVVREVGLSLEALVAPGVAVEVAVPARAVTVRSDRGKLVQVLTNLAGNAAKFTAEGSVTLRLSEGEGDGLRVAVIDTGPGIPPNHQQAIFEAFRQVDGSATRKHGGTGLGLAIASRLAQLLGGQIELSSEPGVGSTFALFLPRSCDDLSPAAEAAEPAEASTPPAPPVDAVDDGEALLALTKPVDPGALVEAVQGFLQERPGHVLVVDDDEGSRGVASGVLEHAGYEVEQAADGIESLERMHARPPAVVVLDLMMPNLSGFDVLATMAGDPTLRGVPVVVLTAKDLDPEEALRLRGEVADVVEKASAEVWPRLLRALREARPDLPAPVGAQEDA
jgi:signal transduction histidine kinase/CheY-like chemotaxis protein